MEGSKSVTERDKPGVKPLALSIQTIALILVMAIALWSIAFFLWRQVEFDKLLLLSHNGLRTNEFVISVALLSNKILSNMTRERLNFAIKVWAVVLLGLMIFLVVM